MPRGLFCQIWPEVIEYMTMQWRWIILMTIILACNLGRSLGQNSITISMRSGLQEQITTDQLLNYYTYRKESSIPVLLDGLYSRGKNIFALSAFYQSSRLLPDHLEQTSYTYNYLRHWETTIRFDYFHKLIDHDFLTVAAGISTSSNMVTQEQHYKSLLLNGAEGFRKSYDIAISSLSPSLLISFNFKKSNLWIKGYYTLAHLAARPDDGYVKQIGLKNSLQWKWYSPREYRNNFLCIGFRHLFGQSIGMIAEYEVAYRSYTGRDKYRYLRHSCLAGIFKTFNMK